jgi:hypothetical protein
MNDQFNVECRVSKPPRFRLMALRPLRCPALHSRVRQYLDPDVPEERDDTWTNMAHWNRRCTQVRQLIDVMLGCPVLTNPDDWARQSLPATRNLRN